MDHFPIGTALCVAFPFFTHFGVYVGQGRVVHLCKANKQVRNDTLDRFSGGRRISRRDSTELAHVRTARRARSFVGLAGYNLVSWNCETFVQYCRTGRAFSDQSRVGPRLVWTHALTVVAVAFVAPTRRRDFW